MKFLNMQEPDPDFELDFQDIYQGLFTELWIEDLEKRNAAEWDHVEAIVREAWLPSVGLMDFLTTQSPTLRGISDTRNSQFIINFT